MNRNVSVSMFALTVMIVYFGVSPGAAAQGQQRCVTYVVSAFYSFSQSEPQLPASSFNCFGIPYAFESECEVQNFLCPPAAAASETCTNGCVPAPAGPANAPASPTAGHPISLATGNTYIKETDVTLPGLSGGLTLARVWNSLWPATQTAYQIGLFGPNWRSTFEERVFVGGDHYMKYARSDGSFWSFGFSSYCANGAPCYLVAAPANVSATLIQGPANWTIAFQNGEQKLFDTTTGHLLAVIDRNGNTTQLSYDSVGRLVTVADPVSRHLYFAYGNGSSYLVTGVTSDVGLSLSYSYDSQGRLIQVTEPDLSTLSFQYNSQSLITLVTDSIGHTLESHTYDSSGRGLTSSQANGVGAVTLSY